MVSAYLLINVEAGQENAVIRKLSRKGITKARVVYGVYDVVAEVKVGNMKDLYRLVERIRKLRDIRNTITLVVV